MVILLPFAISAKSLGNYKGHQQITDKEVLFETTKGQKILISADDDYIIGVQVFGNGLPVKLTTPEQVRTKATSLKGSIYVEEIHDAIQVTTTMSDGLYIRIEKSPFKLTYLQKDNYQVLASESKGFFFGKSSCNVTFQTNPLFEKIELISHLPDGNIQSSPVQKGKSVNLDDLNAIEKEHVLVSSKGYSIIFKGKKGKSVFINKDNELAIQTNSGDSNCFGYKLQFGQTHNEYLERTAQQINIDHSTLTIR